MIFIFIFGFLCATIAEELVQEPENSSCNCTRVLHDDEISTEVIPTFPSTSFTCWGRYDGYYADIEVDCTIFHYCQTWHFPSGYNETVKWDFACPQSTIFNQKVLSCTPPNLTFDCQESPNYYWVNYNLTATTTEPPIEPEEYSTPVGEVGQQLIVGGLGQHSAAYTDPAELDSTVKIPSSEILPPETDSNIALPPESPSNNALPEELGSGVVQPSELESNSVIFPTSSLPSESELGSVQTSKETTNDISDSEAVSFPQENPEKRNNYGNINDF